MIDENRERAVHLVKKCEIVADGHKLMTVGAHTGHVWRVVAYCETSEIAASIADALARAKTE